LAIGIHNMPLAHDFALAGNWGFHKTDLLRSRLTVTSGYRIRPASVKRIRPDASGLSSSVHPFIGSGACGHRFKESAERGRRHSEAEPSV
jgi:hypothetical protein